MKILVAAVPALMSALSCSRTELSLLASRGEGLLTLSCNVDQEVLAVTRAGEEPVLAVTVSETETGKVVRTVEDHRTLADEPMVLPEGKYTVLAYAGDNIQAGFDSPYYEGTTEVTVEAGAEAQAELTATIANVKVTVSRSETVTQSFTDFSVTVSNGLPNGSLEYADETLSSEGYFPCTGTLSWVLSITSSDGRSYTLSDDIQDVQPKEHYNIHFDVDGEVFVDKGGLSSSSIKVTIDSRVNESEHTVTIPIGTAVEPRIREMSGLVDTRPDDAGEDYERPASYELRLTEADIAANTPGLFRIESEAGLNRVVVRGMAAFSDGSLPDSLNLFDPNIALLYKASAAEAGMTWTDGVQTGTKEMQVDFRPLFATLPVGTYDLSVSALDRQRQYVLCRMVITVLPDMEVQLDEVEEGNVWSSFANVSAEYKTESEPAGMTFQYRKTGDADWTVFPADQLVKEGRKFSAKIAGLEPGTGYEVWAITDAEQNEANIASFVTEEETQLPNFNFDSWSDNGHSANAEGTSFWDSGNEGASTLNKYPTSQETGYVKAGSAVKMVSQFVGLGSLGKFAGGNIYSGAYVETHGMSGASIDFGRPYTSRPSKLHGWYSYAPVVIDYAEGIHGDKKGELDVGKIYVALMSSGPFRVNNSTDPKTLFDPSADNVIAYGELNLDQSTGSEYKEFTIELDYRYEDVRPTYVLVVATASAYADYFTGGNGSTLYIDEFEFIFE
ncbi:MAG TPA: DUF4493 domain-containing protein [Candidatus Coprenecus stercorigallinarum]|nr:DUF4493 domain-containing protein [Candidatus Coprenecus stercorigallinarum]